MKCGNGMRCVVLRYGVGVSMRTNLFIRGGRFNFRCNDICEVQNPKTRNTVRASKTNDPRHERIWNNDYLSFGGWP